MVSGPTPAGHRGDRGGDLAHGDEVDVADQRVAALRQLAAALLVARVQARDQRSAVVDAVDADVDHHRAGLDELARHQRRLADRGDQDVRLAADRGEVAGARVARRHRGVAREQQRGHRLADDLRAAEHDGPAPLERAPRSASSRRDDAGRRARHERRPPLVEEADVGRVEAVDVLGRVDEVEEGAPVERRRQRQLEQDAVDVLVGVELRDERGELGRRVVAAGSCRVAERMPDLLRRRCALEAT